MKKSLHKFMSYMLILLLVAMPLRSVYAMPMEISGDHCQSMVQMQDQDVKHSDMMHDMATMDHSKHQMPSQEADHNQVDATRCHCCSQCDDGCSGCTHITAITYELLQLSNVTTTELYLLPVLPLLNRVITPPSRPPLSLV